jgi:hypothetical protein
MLKFQADNYSMGRSVKRATFEARTHNEAVQIAQTLVPGANALPGTHPRAAARAQVIGVQCIGGSRV